MKKILAPSLESIIGDHCVLWFQWSNTYSVVDIPFKQAIDSYIASPNLESFHQFFPQLSDDEVQIIWSQIGDYLESCNFKDSILKEDPISFESGHRRFSNLYDIAGKIVKVYFDRPSVQSVIHPALQHFVSKSNQQAQVVFDLYLSNGEMLLFQDGHLLQKVPQQDYHFIQGKFKMALFNLLHQKEEKDWIGTLHASTITDGESCIAFIGKSGSGKSTLCSLLVGNGFELLADDISPMALENSDIYHNPAAISIKQKAFSVLEPLFPEFDMLQEVKFNPKKGVLKYLPCPAPRHMFYPCNAMVLVNYKSDTETKLQPISVKEILETIIPDSWLHPDQGHAKAFLNWLGTLKFYELTYFDNQEMIDTVSKLFNS